MAITGPENVWWWDVLQNGASSVYASYFDVEWHPKPPPRQVLLPILGDHYGRELDAGRIEVRRRGGQFVFAYFDHLMPVNPRSLDTRPGSGRDTAAGGRRVGAPSATRAFGHRAGRLPSASSTDRDSVAERHRDKEILAARLANWPRTIRKWRLPSTPRWRN